MAPREQIDQYHQEGYYVTEDAVDRAMLPELLAASKHAKKQVRSGAVDVYTHWATDQNTEP